MLQKSSVVDCFPVDLKCSAVAPIKKSLNKMPKLDSLNPNCSKKLMTCIGIGHKNDVNIMKIDDCNFY